VVLIGGLIPLSIAIQDSGAADLIAERIVDIVGDRGPYALMLALFVLTAVLGQIVSNTATVLIVVPIALSAAAETGISGATGVDAGGGGRGGLTADPDRHPGEHDGDGSWWVPVRGLLEVRPGHHDRLARTGDGVDSDGLAVLLMPGSNRQCVLLSNRVIHELRSCHRRARTSRSLARASGPRSLDRPVNNPQ
jgi:hypothetical protein